MNERERYLAALRFERPDRIPFMPGNGRRSTLEAWHRQGLRSDVVDYHDHVRALIGIESGCSRAPAFPGVEFRMIPQFEERVIERREETLVVQDWKGNICEISNRFDTSYLREAIDFVTRAWIRCPVESRADWPDMAYKEKPMIGPDMCREFLAPCWRSWAGLLKGAGVPIVEIDSDGHVGELIPVWIEAGVNCNSPQEAAAGNDLPAYRRRFGSSISYRGGVDKRAMAKGGRVLQDEMDRLRPAIQAGGYIPGCDHGIPPDVSWPNFVEYCRRLAVETGWL